MLFLALTAPSNKTESGTRPVALSISGDRTFDIRRCIDIKKVHNGVWKTEDKLPRKLDADGVCVPNFAWAPAGWWFFIPGVKDFDAIVASFRALYDAKFFSPSLIFNFASVDITKPEAMEIIEALRFGTGLLDQVDVTAPVVVTSHSPSSVAAAKAAEASDSESGH